MNDPAKHFFSETLLFWIFELGGGLLGAGIGSLLGSLEVGAFFGLLVGGFAFAFMFKRKSSDSQM